VRFGSAGAIDATGTGSVTVTADVDGVAGTDTGQGALFMADGATIAGGSGTIDLSADEDITLGGVTTTNTNTGTLTGSDAVTITTAGGVVDGGASDVDLVANSGSVTIDAATGVGDAGNIDTQILSLVLTNSTSGDVDINELDSLDINEITQSGTGTITVYAGTASTTTGTATITVVAGPEWGYLVRVAR